MIIFAIYVSIEGFPEYFEKYNLYLYISYIFIYEILILCMTQTDVDFEYLIYDSCRIKILNKRNYLVSIGSHFNVLEIITLRNGA